MTKEFIDDKEMKAIIEENSGIGTPATRADIIEKLFNVNYIWPIGEVA